MDAQDRQALDAPPKVSVVIVNLNGGDMLPRCLDFVYGQRLDEDFDITVVDNGSFDHSIRKVQAHYPQTRVILLKNNIGYSAALNRGIDQTDGQYVLALNFDVELAPDFLDRALSAFDKGPKIGMVSGKLWGSSAGSDPRIIDTTGIVMNELFMADRGQGEEDDGRYDETDYVFGPSGAAALYSREMLEDLRLQGQYVDEDFFAFVEDVDLAWRARLRGWRAVYTPEATGVHYRGATRHNNAERRRQYLIWSVRNRYWMLLKNLSAGQWKVHRARIIRSELRGLGRFIKHYGLHVALSALWQSLRGSGKIRRKRREIQSRMSATRSSLDVYLFPK
ncbi:MAG: glycosyltransferase family 2 protein [Candidatus Alcyoniella australis]|nr:glycosyltransferase family 2 protein [Candidatus Alcyoniella australis]